MSVKPGSNLFTGRQFIQVALHVFEETKIAVINDPESVPKRLSSDNFNLIKA